MDLKSVLLGFLRREDCTGYELKAAMDHSVGFFFGASYGSIYPALKALKADGMVQVREVVQSGKPNKKIYTLTPEGEAYFREQLKEQPASDSFRSEFLMQLFFGQHQDSDRLLALLSEHRATRKAKLELLRGIEAAVKDVADPYEMMCLRYGVTSFEATLSWLDETEAQVKALSEEKEHEVENEAS
ncbi:MAG: PadR family transcriptional regulator [Rubrobacteraceae bacterium]